MSVNLMLGINGSGKSYESVVYHVLPALKRGRKVITNLPLNLEAFGQIDPDFIDLIELRNKPQPILGSFDSTREGTAFLVGEESAAVEDDQLDERRATFDIFRNRAVGSGHDRPARGAKCYGNVWDFYTTWRHSETGMGPLFIIDECHNALPKIGTSREVEDWFAIHRHFNIDVLLITQSYGKINEAIRDLVKVCYRVRKATAFGTEKRYIRRVLDGVRGSVIDEGLRDYKPQYFPLYRSHTQGVAVEEIGPDDVASKIAKWRKLLRAWWIMFGVLLVALLWHIFTKEPPTKPVPKGHPILGKGVPAGGVPLASPVRPMATGPGLGSSPVVKVTAALPEPMELRGLHLSGCITMRDRTTCSIVVSQNGQPVFSLTHHDLETMGYVYQPMTDCAARLRWKDTVRIIICDLPHIGMGVAGVSSSTSAVASTVSKAPTELPMPDFSVEQPGHINQSQIRETLGLKNPTF